MEFKVGDIVRCTNVDGETYHEGVGTHSIITEIDRPEKNWPINAVDVDGNWPGMEVAFSESEIELVYRETHPLEDKVRQLADKWEDDYNNDSSGEGWVDGLMRARQELLELLNEKSN